MNSANKKTADGLINRYQTNLERRIEKGDRSLICRDEDFCKEVERLLHSGNAQKMHNLHGLDSLAVMEKSLHAFPSKTGQMGLEKVSKAFEVLELAALNLYIYPWRREYRLVKMFSGMFTHLIKPALTLQQAKELFGLLGYQASSPNEEEELALNSKLVPADFLLSLACGFFIARMECQLLLSALGSVDKGVEWVLQLVKERQVGHSLQIALENTKRKSDAASVSEAILTGGMDAELDLYTEQADASHMISISDSPPDSSYMQPKEKPLSKTLQREPSQSNMGNNEDARQGKSLINPGPMESFAEDQIEGDAQRQAAAKLLCKCITPNQLYIYECENCKDMHISSCSRYRECKMKGHTLALCSDKAEELYSTQDQIRLAKEKSKDSLKTHYCMDDPTSDSFLVCYECQLIHDHNCNIIQMCNLKQHNVQPTGKLQPPQGEQANAQKRHKCLSAAHHKQYSQETGDTERPIPYHDYCWKGDQTLPETVCLTCKVFHFSGCPDRRHCSQKHNMQNVKTYCVTCLSFDHSTLQVCRYCGDVYCTLCCYKYTLMCRCGKAFLRPSSV
ncbi:spermatogenesis-associated protein 2-like protein [Sinocyclocheilus anshuiensis]|uniref:Spermatogenesis-associated protein 2-like protein n=1 Tax=Sinocyclocheilus anshuiensis TaxID=1608454 RepID=A0A671MQ72_9TELE|nr:PREDICTED: spermatogenesis-associated protein 2-like protein [Sinocyclocheilus anshuiensis]XP_016336476.1 PREDICTED: spermatogenesis-associated protein 2-like protein [Sinocyclocheilus anshuiensis]